MRVVAVRDAEAVPDVAAPRGVLLLVEAEGGEARLQHAGLAEQALGDFPRGQPDCGSSRNGAEPYPSPDPFQTN